MVNASITFLISNKIEGYVVILEYNYCTVGASLFPSLCSLPHAHINALGRERSLLCLCRCHLPRVPRSTVLFKSYTTNVASFPSVPQPRRKTI
jgi:hypothetical protein